MIINHNIAAMNTYNKLSANNAATSKSLEKLSSGLRINRAGDDAAGLAISEKMRAQIRGLDQASNNAQDGISLIQTAEGALTETHSILQRMRELAVQSANDTNTNADRTEIQKEVDELAKEVTRIANDTEFNTQKLVNGAISDSGLGSMKFHIGANADQNITLSVAAMDAKSLGVSRDTSTNTGTTAGDINTATFSDPVGSGIANGAVLTFQYTAGSAATAATAGQVTGAAGTPATSLAGIAADAALTVTIDSVAYTVDSAALKTASNAGAGTMTDFASAIQTAIGANGSVSVNAGALVITSATTGTTSNVTIGIASSVGADVTAIQTATGLTNAATDTGDAAVAAVSAKVTVSDGAITQDVNIDDATATSFSVEAGRYKGVSITMDATKSLADLDSVNDTVTVAQTVNVSSAASFSAGVTTAAVAYAGLDVSTQDAANDSITVIQKAIETVSAERSKMGAYQNRLEHTINNLDSSSENISSAESRIRDVDMAKEMMNYQKGNILNQAATAMLAQANQLPQGVLQLLR
ncbi:MAG: flagellin [Veillonellaceae bacterium]|nr:flagellin [Veillonellaceae bacterium]